MKDGFQFAFHSLSDLLFFFFFLSNSSLVKTIPTGRLMYFHILEKVEMAMHRLQQVCCVLSLVWF